MSIDGMGALGFLGIVDEERTSAPLHGPALRPFVSSVRVGPMVCLYSKALSAKEARSGGHPHPLLLYPRVRSSPPPIGLLSQSSTGQRAHDQSPHPHLWRTMYIQ